MSHTAEVADAATTEVIEETISVSDSAPTVLRLNDDGPSTTTTDSEPHVRWTTETVDNEGMGKKKSKCCCIYKKQKKWEDSDTSDDEHETDHCRGHVDKKPGSSSGGGSCGKDCTC